MERAPGGLFEGKEAVLHLMGCMWGSRRRCDNPVAGVSRLLGEEES
jgi:hypothetical protein